MSICYCLSQATSFSLSGETQRCSQATRAYPVLAPWPPPGGTCLKHLIQKAPKRDPSQKPEPLQLKSISTMSPSQKSELLNLSVRQRPAIPWWKPLFGTNICNLFAFKLSSLFTMRDQYSVCITAAMPWCICQSLTPLSPHLWTRTQDPKTPPLGIATHPCSRAT